MQNVCVAVLLAEGAFRFSVSVRPSDAAVEGCSKRPQNTSCHTLTKVHTIILKPISCFFFFFLNTVSNVRNSEDIGYFLNPPCDTKTAVLHD